MKNSPKKTKPTPKECKDKTKKVAKARGLDDKKADELSACFDAPNPLAALITWHNDQASPASPPIPPLHGAEPVAAPPKPYPDQ